MKRRKTITDSIQNILVLGYGLMMIAIILICIFFPHIEFARNESELGRNYLPAVVLLMFGMIFISGLFTFSKGIESLKIRNKKYILLSVALCLFLVQIYSVYNYYFYTDWDVPQLINLSDAVAHGEDVSNFSGYFSRYPNNLFLAYIFSLIRKAVHLVGLHKHEYFALLCVQCFLSALTGLLLISILDKLFNNDSITVLGYILYIFLVGMSPWTSIPYSDSMGLLFPILIIYFYVNRYSTNHTLLFWFKITVVSVIGYKIKPQIFIIFIAILIIELLNTIKFSISKSMLKAFAGIALGIICAGFISQMALSSLNIAIDKNETFNLPHFFMMGMNPDDMGVWSKNDVDFSGSFPTSAERNEANINMVIERIENMGAVGVAKQFVRKTLTNYYDGTFCWSGEGTFFYEVFQERNNPLCSFFRSLYYTRSCSEIGKYFLLWSNFEQMIWLTILLLNIFSISNPKTSDKNILMLCIIGLTIFELLFEARARYLFTYAPLYIILAMYGFDHLKELMNRL